MKADLNKYFERKAFINDRLNSFRYAFRGLYIMVKNEHNARIYLVILIIVAIAGLVLKIKAQDWIAIAFAAGLVIAGECFNTAIEYLSDVVSPEYNEKIKGAKDIAAAGVLISAIVSVIIGLVIFIPAIVRILRI